MEWHERQSLPQRQARRHRGTGADVQREAQRAARSSEATATYTAGGTAAFMGDSAESLGADAAEGETVRPELRAGAEEGAHYEYLDHTADVQLHAWGATLQEAFENAALALFNYMTPLSGVGQDACCNRLVCAEGHDMHSLLYGFLDELLFLFSTELVVFSSVRILELDRETWTLQASGSGEVFDRARHACGTEVKAITYSAMQISEQTAQGDCEVFVIVDI